MQTKPEEAAVTIQQDSEMLPFTRRETVFTMIGVLFVVFLSMLDQTTPLQSYR